MTGLDAVVEFRAERETRDAFDETIPDGVSRSEVLREMLSDRIESQSADVPDELLRDARRARANRRSDKDVDAATFRKRAKNLAKSLYGSGLTASEIGYAYRRRRDEAEHLPEELNPDAAKEYVDCLLALVRLYDGVDPNDAHGTDGLPNDLYPALDVVDSAYPDEHEDETRDIIRRAPTDESVVREIDDAVSNGLVDGLIEDDGDSVPDDADIKMGGEVMTDGGVDVGAARDAAEDDAQAGVETFEIDGEAVEYATRRERIRDVLDGDLVGLTVSHRTSGAVYMIATRRVDWGDVDAEDAARHNWRGVDKRMIIWDTDDEDVVVTDRGFWVPEDADTMRAEARQASRASSEIDGKVDADDPLVVDATDEDKLDADAFLSRSVEVVDEEEEREGQHTERLRNDDGIDDNRAWGYGGPAPPEAEIVEERLRGAGLDPEDHFFRLKWGTKEPFETVDKSQSPPSRGRPRDELLGNYGIDCLSRDVGLVCVDVDYPEEFPDDAVPDTFAVSSPHGSDDQRHLLFLCDNKGELKDEIGAWSTQAPEWGDLWAGANRYVVGPGSQLSAYGCNEGKHVVEDPYDVDEPHGCERCESEDAGYYEIVNDAPIMAVSAERLAELVPDDDEDDVDEAGNPVSTESDAPEGMVVADCCGAAYVEDAEGEAFMQAGNRVVCLGGCPE